MKIRTLRSGTQEIIMKQSNTFSIIFSNTQLDLQVGNMNEVNIKKVNMDTIIFTLERRRSGGEEGINRVKRRRTMNPFVCQQNRATTFSFTTGSTTVEIASSGHGFNTKRTPTRT